MIHGHSFGEWFGLIVGFVVACFVLIGPIVWAEIEVIKIRDKENKND